METCYVVAERFSSADFLHGPLAVVERHFPIFTFAPPGVTLAGVKELLGRLKELRAGHAHLHVRPRGRFTLYARLYAARRY